MNKKEIELVKPTWGVGSEKRFFNFIKDLDAKDKIAVFSHTDVDGIVAAKIANLVIGANFVRYLNHSEINDDLLKWIKKNKINKIFMSDIAFPDRKYLRKVEKMAKVVIVDHHTFKEDLNTPKSIFLNAQGFCASYLCYYLFSKTQNLENYDWLVACASLFDWMFVQNKDWMSAVFEKYGQKFTLVDKELKQTEFWRLQYEISLASIYFNDNLSKVSDNLWGMYGNIGDLLSYAKEVDAEIFKQISEFWIKKEDIKEGYYMEFQSKFPVEALVVNLLSAGNPNKTFIVSQEKDGLVKVSSRRQDGKVNLPELMRSLIVGFEKGSAGGHVKAAGASFPIIYKEEFLKRLKGM
jgi:single-stranded DNA-specific DHH superfamily exonuclease